MAKMSVDALKNEVTNPARTYLWDLIIPDPGGGSTETFMVRCQSTSIPGRSVGQILIPYKQSAGVVFPGKLTYDHILDLTFVENQDRETLGALYDWCQKIVHDRTNVGSGDTVVKKDMYLHLLNTDGSVADKLRLVGCYIQAVAPVALSYADEAIVAFVATFAYDRWEKV